MIDMELLQNIFLSYNLAIQTKCEEFLGTVKNQSDYQKLIDDARNEWENTKFKGVEPKKYFALVENKADAAEIFKTAALMCDEFIPRSLADMIIATDNISMMANFAHGEFEIEIRSAAIRLLGLSKKVEYTEKLIDLLYDCGESEELIKEKARQAIIDIGEGAVLYIGSQLAAKKQLSNNDFHLIIALIEIDKDKKSDYIFSIIKDSFRKTDEKALAARCLSDYGDGRAVPMLRSYLERNLNEIDRDTAFEIQGAILNLGGSADGLDIPFG